MNSHYKCLCASLCTFETVQKIKVGRFVSSKYGIRCQTIMAIVISIVNSITRVKINFDASAGFLLLYLYQHMQIYISFSRSTRVPVTLEPIFI